MKSAEGRVQRGWSPRRAGRRAAGACRWSGWGRPPRDAHPGLGHRLRGGTHSQNSSSRWVPTVSETSKSCRSCSPRRPARPDRRSRRVGVVVGSFGITIDAGRSLFRLIIVQLRWVDRGRTKMSVGSQQRGLVVLIRRHRHPHAATARPEGTPHPAFSVPEWRRPPSCRSREDMRRASKMRSIGPCRVSTSD